MDFRPCSLLFAALVITHPALAAEDCAKTIGELIANRKLDGLAALFGPHASELRPALRALDDRMGAVSGLTVTSHPRFARSFKESVRRPDLPSSFAYTGVWIDAESRQLGPVQFHAAFKPDGMCELLALHVEQAADAAPANRNP